ncbi:hypothetical protein [Paenibacillus glycanilyticus]|uniref:DUF2642 domain-containing protein n=1 Tax=Paenibacillus glycanilyticus TaxID=126569 RepID=A0ABQ6GNL2_9BACL|nr:hypothetical protein [Paenibacillus glycanilyticus]GLX70612.1 hypothetical protein MU1_49580 [Paenibacillus glycanilyticus]
MKIIVNERELKEYFDGLAKLLQSRSSDRFDATALIAELRQSLREELAEAYLDGQRSGANSFNKLKQVFDPYTGRPAELLTPAGTVEGTIAKVSGEYLIVREHGGTSVMVPLEQLVSFQLTGKQVER